MKLLFIADGRSPTTLSWLSYWIGIKNQVHLISTYPCEAPDGLASFHIIPVAYSGMAGGGTNKARSLWISRIRSPLQAMRYILGPASLPHHQKQFIPLVDSIHPDLVHALRIPFEGMMSLVTPKDIPFVVSIWGNDITLHAKGSPWMATLTRRVLQRADGLFADSQRDLQLGMKWGLRTGVPTLLVPGAGGIRLDQIKVGNKAVILPEGIPDGPLVVNFRGQRPGSLRQDVFFRAIPRVLEKIPEAIFICPSLRGDPQAENWVDSLGIKARTRLWPKLPQDQLWALLSKAQVYVSPSLHDGVPNSLLEAMACGCFPVTGNIESMREWISNGINGLLVDATNEEALAGAIIRAIKEPALQIQAAHQNATLVAERADYTRNMQRVKELYGRVAARE